jgi:hypothetical protein
MLSGLSGPFSLRKDFLDVYANFLIPFHRQAQELGLHRQKEVYQSSKTNIGETLNKFWYEQNKKRLWINLFLWDR